MPTRRATQLSDMEKQLQMTLHELKTTKEDNERLLRERADNEKECFDVLHSQQLLKGEMAEMHNQLLDAVEARDDLQRIVDRFDQDSSHYEETLERISSLQKQLREAQVQITFLQSENDDLKMSQTQTTFHELVGNPHSISAVSRPQQNTVTIDLTNDESICNRTQFPSKNKLKKYVKINKYIIRTNKLIKKNRTFCKNVNIRKERQKLIHELDMCSVNLEKCTLNYECDTQRLGSEILSLTTQLQSITDKYQLAQKQISEHMLAMDGLLEMSKYNNDRFESLTNNHLCDCMKSSASHSSPAVSPAQPVCRSSTHSTRASDQLTSPRSDAQRVELREDCDAPLEQNIIMYCDEIGKSMGSQLVLSLGKPVINNCMPGASYSTILDKICSTKFIGNNNTLVIFIGRRGNINKSLIRKYVSSLAEIENINKIFLFALPFSKGFSNYENNLRHDLNMAMHTTTSCHSNKFCFLDTNIFISKNFSVTKDNYYLSKFYTRHFATLVAYNILNIPLTCSNIITLN